MWGQGDTLFLYMVCHCGLWTLVVRSLLFLTSALLSDQSTSPFSLPDTREIPLFSLLK
jgi:hypothetical protein